MSKRTTEGPTDGLKYGEWQTRYPRKARKQYYGEAIYLATLLVLVVGLLLSLWLGGPQNILGIASDPGKSETFFRYSCAWLVGTMGGILYDIKWLYRSVARQLWHVDRRLWRLFTPHISGALSFGMIALVSSGLITIFNPEVTRSSSAVAGLSFLVGYFSDSAIAKLAEVADTLFGRRNTEQLKLDSSAEVLEPPTDAEEPPDPPDEPPGPQEGLPKPPEDSPKES